MGQIGQQQFLELIWFYGSYIVFFRPTNQWYGIGIAL